MKCLCSGKNQGSNGKDPCLQYRLIFCDATTTEALSGWSRHRNSTRREPGSSSSAWVRQASISSSTREASKSLRKSLPGVRRMHRPIARPTSDIYFNRFVIAIAPTRRSDSTYPVYLMATVDGRSYLARIAQVLRARRSLPASATSGSN